VHRGSAGSLPKGESRVGKPRRQLPDIRTRRASATKSSQQRQHSIPADMAAVTGFNWLHADIRPLLTRLPTGLILVALPVTVLTDVEKQSLQY
jgi:hypothetical protein